MNKLFSFFKSFFINKNKVKLLEPPMEIIKKQDNSNFLASLKVDQSKDKKKKQIETLTCVGDGLGIQNIMNY